MKETFGHLLVRMFRQIRAGYVANGRAHQSVGGKMSFPRQSDETDSGRQSVSAPLEPSFIGIPMCDDAGESKAGRRVSGRERFATLPKFALTVGFVRILTIGCTFEEQSDSVRGTHGFERGPPRVRCVRRPVPGAANCVHQAGGA